MLVPIAIVVVLVATVAASTPDEARSPTAPRATVAITNVQPVTVTGRGFKPGERVRVSAATVRAQVRAGARGRFVVRFTAVDPCNSFSVSATGSKGSRASRSYSPGRRIHCASP